ncbi:MAG: MFS transporter, partial [Bacteroidota bacterium]
EKGAGGIPQNIMWSFYIGAFVFLCAVLYTIFRSKEYPPSDPDWKSKAKAESGGGIINGAIEIFQAILEMPGPMRRLAVVQFLTWPGLFLMWFYYSTGVAAQIFKGDVETSSELYTRGLELANETSAILNLVTFAFSFTIPFWVKQLGKKMTHTVCLLIGGLGLISVSFVSDPSWLFASMSMVGSAWASILSMPYSLLSGCIPAERTGIYMGVFNFFIVLPEILASVFFGKIMENYLGNDRLLAVMIGGILLCTAGVVCALIVKENASPEKGEVQ